MLFHAAIVPNLVDHPVPPPHPDLTKYFYVPPKLIKKSGQVLDVCRRVFNISQVPKKAVKRKAEMHVAAIEDDDLILAPSKKLRQQSPAKDEGTKNNFDCFINDKRADASETESEADNVTQADALESVVEPRSSAAIKPDISSAKLNEEMDIDHAIPEGRIIGTTYPLEDFKSNLSSGDIVTKAVEDLAFIIQEIALQSFAERRQEELIDCLQEMRSVCLREDEVDLWNE